MTEAAEQIPLTSATEEVSISDRPIHEYIKAALESYFCKLDGHTPNNLYEMVLRETEQPLLETVMRYARGNQTRAAEMLGINRGTLRKKLKQYGLN